MTLKRPNSFLWRVTALDWVTQMRTSTEVTAENAVRAIKTASDTLKCPESAVEHVKCLTGKTVHTEERSDLTKRAFFKGYIQALGFTGRSEGSEGECNNEPAFSGAGNFDENWDVWQEIKDVIRDEDLIDIWSDINGFFHLLSEQPQAVIDEVEQRTESAGSDFCLTRQGQGAGFWDGDWENGDVLTEISQSFGTYDMVVQWTPDDQNDLYLSGVYFHS